LICWPEECNETLRIPSGKLAIQDPANGPCIEIQTGGISNLKVTYLFGELDVAAVELQLQAEKESEYFTPIGVVGVDSASIVIGDQSLIENCPDNALFLYSSKENKRVAEKIVKRFRLDTRPICSGVFEVVTDNTENLYEQMSNYVSTELRESPFTYLGFHPTNGFWERCLAANFDGGFCSVNNSRVFMINTGSDGRFGVVGGYCGDILIKVWIIFDYSLIVNEKVEYTLRPLATRPQRKPPSAAFVAWMKQTSALRRKKPWWKFWKD
jgi:hypothetical protein